MIPGNGRLKSLIGIKKVFGVGVILLLLTGCALAPRSSTAPEPLTVKSGPVKLKLLEHKVLAEQGFFPTIVQAYHKFYFMVSLFLPGETTHQWIYSYNDRLQPLGFAKQLTYTPYVTGEPDSALVFYQEHFYHAYSASSEMKAGEPTWGNELFLAKYDRNFNLQRSLQVVKDGSPQEETNDMFLEVAQGKVYLGTNFEFLQNGGGYSRGILLRVFDLNLKLRESKHLLVPGLSLHSGGHLLKLKDKFYLFIGASVKGQGRGQNIWVLVFNENFKLLKLKRLTQGWGRAASFPKGPVFSAGWFYLPYTLRPNLHRAGYPEDSGNIGLGIYDQDFNLSASYIITHHKPFSGIGSHRGCLAQLNDKLYLLYDTHFAYKKQPESSRQVEAFIFKIIKP
jgi:hypothetical protein